MHVAETTTEMGTKRLRSEPNAYCFLGEGLCVTHRSPTSRKWSNSRDVAAARRSVLRARPQRERTAIALGCRELPDLPKNGRELLWLVPIRLGLSYASKELSRALQPPTQGDYAKLTHAAGT